MYLGVGARSAARALLVQCPHTASTSTVSSAPGSRSCGVRCHGSPPLPTPECRAPGGASAPGAVVQPGSVLPPGWLAKGSCQSNDNGPALHAASSAGRKRPPPRLRAVRGEVWTVSRSFFVTRIAPGSPAYPRRGSAGSDVDNFMTTCRHEILCSWTLNDMMSSRLSPSHPLS